MKGTGWTDETLKTIKELVDELEPSLIKSSPKSIAQQLEEELD